MSWNKHEAVSYARSHALTHTDTIALEQSPPPFEPEGLKSKGQTYRQLQPATTLYRHY